MILSCLLIAGDPVRTALLEQFIASTDGIEEIKSMPDIPSALQQFRKRQLSVDIIFVVLSPAVDVPWPQVRQLHKYGAVICTGTDVAQAAEAFRAHAVDFLTEPVCYTHFVEALLKARQLWQSRQPQIDFLFVRDTISGTLVRIDVQAILYMKSQGNYVQLYHQPDGYLLIHRSLCRLLRQLPAGQFVRIQRSHAVNIAQICYVEQTLLYLTGGIELEIGSAFKKEFLKKVERA